MELENMNIFELGKRALTTIKSRNEAEVVVECLLWMNKLDSALRTLFILLDFLDQLLQCSTNTSRPLCRFYLSNLQISMFRNRSVILSKIDEVLKVLRRIEEHLQQYGSQNNVLALELEEASCNNLCQNKRNIATVELEMCRRLSALLQLSCGQDVVELPVNRSILESLLHCVQQNCRPVNNEHQTNTSACNDAASSVLENALYRKSPMSNLKREMLQSTNSSSSPSQSPSQKRLRCENSDQYGDKKDSMSKKDSLPQQYLTDNLIHGLDDNVETSSLANSQEIELMEPLQCNGTDRHIANGADLSRNSSSQRSNSLMLVHSQVPSPLPIEDGVKDESNIFWEKGGLRSQLLDVSTSTTDTPVKGTPDQVDSKEELKPPHVFLSPNDCGIHRRKTA